MQHIFVALFKQFYMTHLNKMVLYYFILIDFGMVFYSTVSLYEFNEILFQNTFY